MVIFMSITYRNKVNIEIAQSKNESQPPIFGIVVYFLLFVNIFIKFHKACRIASPRESSLGLNLACCQGNLRTNWYQFRAPEK